MKVKSAELRIQSHYKEMAMCPFMNFKNCTCWGGQVQEGAQKGIEKVTMQTSGELYGCVRMEKAYQKLDKH